MPCESTIELRDLVIETDIGTYGPKDVVPDAHLLDLTLHIDPALVMIDADDMARVFDYDPLIADLLRLALDGHYETQERLMTRMVACCATYAEIAALEIFLRKTPVHGGTGTLGVRLRVDQVTLDGMRG